MLASQQILPFLYNMFPKICIGEGEVAFCSFSAPSAGIAEIEQARGGSRLNFR